jgi:RimJ/RimL family protein N-acetyltransferase
MKEEIILQRVTINDQELVQSILDRAPGFYLKVDGAAHIPNMAKREIQGTPLKKSPTYEKYFLVVYLDSKPMGVLDLHKDHPKKGETYIGLLLLDETYQQKGLGRKVYQMTEDYCRHELGAHKLILGVSDDNDVTGFWKKMGFTHNGSDYIWKGVHKETNVREMEKAIS